MSRSPLLGLSIAHLRGRWVFGLTFGLALLGSGTGMVPAVASPLAGLDPLMKQVHTQTFNPLLERAVVEHEDRRFYQHAGLDLTGLLRAGWSSLSGKALEGGSTLTQQLVKNTLLARLHGARTLNRKAQEAWLALQVERRYSKADILKAYLSTSYWGEANGGQLIGARQAARGYFQTSQSRLNLAQSAYLAVLLPAPARAGQTAFLRPLIRHLLDQMVGGGRVTRQAADQAWQVTLRRQ